MLQKLFGYGAGDQGDQAAMDDGMTAEDAQLMKTIM